MMRLILNEVKKILKNKLNLFVILAMIIGMGIVSYLNLSPEDIPLYLDQTPIVLKTFDGKELKNIEEVKAYKHEILSKYHKKADASLWEQYKKDYNNYYKEFTKQYNDAMMKKTYGKDYLDIFNKIKGQVSEEDAIRTSFGQAKNNMTTSQLARYVTTIASRGTSYELTLFDKATDADGNLVEDYQPAVKGEMDVASSTWDAVHKGMRGVAKNSPILSSMKLSVAGKTGTAQEDMSRPSHGLFIGFAPYDNPEVGVAVRIGNGYSSGNAASVAKDILNYKYNFADESDIVTGAATASDTTTTHND